MATVAFKEWAAVCEALGTGRQTVILRKGGIHETAGQFRPEHDRFWLYPTHFHETQQAGLKLSAHELLAHAEATRAPAGTIRFQHLAEVVAVHHLDSLERALALDAFHVWTPETVTQRFHYRQPGLYLLVVRIHAAAAVQVRPERPEYAGCKTWVPLADEVAETGLVPVFSDANFAEAVRAIQSTH